MPRPGIHPMMHMVRVVFGNGSSCMMPMAWQRPAAGLEVTTKFLDVDFLTVEQFVGAGNRHSRKVGRRARFENRFGESGETAEKETE